jgi:hypothetical protein
VDAHLVGVPGLGTLTVRGLTGGDLEDLGGETDGALDAELLVLGTVDELLADLLERLHVAGGEGDADLVDLGALAEVLLRLVCALLASQLRARMGHRTVRHDDWCLSVVLIESNGSHDLDRAEDHGNVMTGVVLRLATAYVHFEVPRLAGRTFYAYHWLGMKAVASRLPLRRR